MRQKRKAISPIIATLILIVITVVAGIFLYGFVSGYMGMLSTTTSAPPDVQITPVSYAIGNNTISGALEVTITNAGSSSVSIYPTGSFYFSNGTLAGSATLGTISYSTSSTGTSTVTFTPLTSLTLAPGKTTVVIIELSPSPSNYSVTSGYSYYIKLTTTSGYTITSQTFSP